MLRAARAIVVVGVTAAVFTGLTSLASAHEDPPGCTTSGLNTLFDTSSGLGVIHRNGDHLELAVRVRNDAANACSVTDATVQVQTPAPDGTPGPLVTVASGAGFPGGMAPTTLPTTVPYDVDLNPSVFSGPVKIAVSGTYHFPAGDAVSAQSATTSVVISKPHITLSVAPSAPSGAAPFAVTYTYSALNDTPVDPAQPLTTPALVAPTSDFAVIADDTCSPLTFTGGDTTVTTPPLLQEGETWTFSCMHLFAGVGDFTNHASIVGTSTRDGRDWPETTAQSTVTATGSDLTVSKTHAGDFTAGDSGRTYTLTARNSGNQPTTGAVTLADSLPSGLTATAISGPGWTCVLATLSCTRSDPLAGASSYPAVTVTVDVAADAPEQVTNTATVAGGGEVPTNNNSASDPTSILRPAASGSKPQPSNEFTFGRAKSKADGTVKLTVNVPGPGELSADDPTAGAKSDAKRKNLIKRARATANQTGAVTLRLRPTRQAKAKLAEKRSLKALVEVTYTPTGGVAGTGRKRVKFKAAEPR